MDNVQLKSRLHGLTPALPQHINQQGNSIGFKRLGPGCQVGLKLPWIPLSNSILMSVVAVCNSS